MQLKHKKNNIGEALAIATSTLLVQSPLHAATQESVEDQDLTLDFSYLDYREVDRVKVREMDMAFDWQMDDDTRVTGKLLTDSITGATPSGALKPPSTGTETLTSPSGVQGASGSGAQTGTFLDPLETIVDRRVGVAGSYTTEVSRGFKPVFGANVSSEDDYSSYGVSAGLAYDFNNKLTTVDGGIAWSWDTVRPEGGPPPELGNVLYSRPGMFKDGEKRIFDRNLGIAQVLNKRTVLKLTYSNGVVDGYLSDPYKVVTLTEPIIDVVTGVQSDQIIGYYHEKRPSSRERNAVVLNMSHQPGDKDALRLKYRYFWDDWDITAHEVDFQYQYVMKNDWYLQPHLRWYKQTAASFYTPSLDESLGENPEFGGSAPQYASADYRLDALKTITVGLKVGVHTRIGHVRFRYESIDQQGTEGDFTELKAAVIHAMWSIKF